MARDSRAGRVAPVPPAGAQRASRGRYLPTAEHGRIGDLHTAVLVGPDGAIDRLCHQIMERGWHPAAGRSSSATRATRSTPPCCGS